MELSRFFKENPSLALGFSGGVDSSYLFYEGVKNKAEIKAYYVKTPFQPEFELEDAKRIAKLINREITIIETNILLDPTVASNPEDRCYYCKKQIFSILTKRAIKDGCKLIIDGSNASDSWDDRPGMKAIKELSVRSPLRECGLTKADVRKLSKEAGLFTWNKPAYACLATRVPAGQEITEALLKKIEMSESILSDQGFTDFRVRVIGSTAKIQVPENQIKEIITGRGEVIKALKPYFSDVLLDLNGR